MLKIGDRLPAAQLYEYVDVATEGCALGPSGVDTDRATSGRTIVVFGLPGAFTPTCSERHVPGYVAHAADFRAAGVDEVWCVSVNDAFVMGAWGRQLGTQGAVRMMGDGNGDFARATGLTLDLGSRGMGLRSARYAMLVVDGVVRTLDVEAAGKFEVSSAEAMLRRLRAD
ncbi:peroxiredoxin [Rubrivivax gelatinosus]|uniref:Glutathione-dependent peroxiredoxin n=1 Tax=Rubrivivax gelatinosus TaxID=28068 RepID=A0A4R2MK67_RUBGE|nr:peroxiredoxin [Rubrivivax gelatinosus]MBK1686259.1 peroxiredoxin [Rubrivivax gelatinosus]TCP05755.1 peroxiredoxin [Rubrivivax gelatinosus]